MDELPRAMMILRIPVRFAYVLLHRHIFLLIEAIPFIIAAINAYRHRGDL